MGLKMRVLSVSVSPFCRKHILTQRSLGHATGTMTARYAKMSESRLREVAAALEKAFAVNGKKESGQVVNGTK
jgi:hypothetical protein